MPPSQRTGPKVVPGVDRVSKTETVAVDTRLLGKIKQAVDAALSYEEVTKRTRKLGITGEVGEVLACHQLRLERVIDPRSEGLDAIDKDGSRVEIKTRTSESDGLSSNAGRTSRFSAHEFDYAILILLNRQYEISETGIGSSGRGCLGSGPTGARHSSSSSRTP